MVAALAAIPSVARAHGTISPATVSSGTSRFVISVPNESINVPITGFRLTAPAGVTIVAAESRFGFRAVSTPTGATWVDGSVSPPGNAIFSFTASIPGHLERVDFRGEEIFGDIESGAFPLPVTVAATTPRPRIGAIGGFRLALIGSGLAAAVVACAGILLMRRRGRGR